MAFAPNQIIDCRIESLALGGKGVARTEGMVVFVAGGVPGATVRAKLTKIAKRHAEAEVVETVTPSPFAAEPFCPHFGTCGGCAHQDIAYDKQVEWKAAQVVETLSRLGGARPETVLPPLPSPKTRYYRNKMEFAFVGPARTLHPGPEAARLAPGAGHRNLLPAAPRSARTSSWPPGSSAARPG